MRILLVQFLDNNFKGIYSTSNMAKDEMFPTMHENDCIFPGKLNLGASFTSLLLNIRKRNNLLQRAQI